MERAYREDELLEATVIDSEGYIYGKVEKINVGEEEITLGVYESKPDMKTIVDVDALRVELLKKVKVPFSARIQGFEPMKILLENIRKELGLKSEETLTDEHCVEYAKRFGISILHKKVETERREPKGDINIREIKAIKVSVIRTDREEKTVKLVLLNDPREALFRNIPVQHMVPYRSTEAIKDKLVIDSNGAALGYVDSVVLFHNGPGIRVYSPEETSGVDLKILNKHLESWGKPRVAKLIRRYFTKDIVRREELEDLMKKAEITLALPVDSVLSRVLKEFLMDVPWDAIHKVGDVIILALTLLDIQSKGYLLK